LSPVEAVRWHAAGDLRFEDVELVLPLGPEMIEVEVAFCGICGSDLAEFRHPFAIRPEKVHPLTGQKPPVTLGHEFSGTVVAVGEDVKAVKVGDRVSADACWRCGECKGCVEGRYNQCLYSGSIGLSSDGAFAPLVRFPAYAAVKLPDNVSLDVAAMLEPLAVGLHALDRGEANAGERVVVIGYGPVGAATALLARSLGLEPLVCELSPGRLARAEAHGFETHAPEPDKKDFARSVRGLTDGGAGVIVDCSGAVPAVEAAMEMSERGGRIVLAGIPKKPLAIDGGRMVLYERSLIATLGYHNDLPRVAAMISSGSLEPSVMITNRIPLSEVADEIERMASDPRDEVKVLAEVVS
jgi:(R,R)-butanediol dehydrogenase / meso-butanediol dehydrogenase / diacetyl reductase